MEREHVDSEAIAGVGYDAAARVLEIEFTSGAIYLYFDVPQYLYVGLMGADSHGQYFAEHIRNAGFDYRHLDEDEARRTRGARKGRGLTRP